MLNVQLRTKWPPEDATVASDDTITMETDNITMATGNDKYKTKQLLELPTNNSPSGSLHSSPRGSPCLSHKEINSPPDLSPVGSSHSSVQSSPYNSPQSSPRNSPQLERDGSTSFEDTTEEVVASDKQTSDDTGEPTVSITTTTSVPSVSQFQQLLDKAPMSSTHQVSMQSRYI